MTTNDQHITFVELSILTKLESKVSVLLKQGESDKGFFVVVSRFGRLSTLVTQRKTVRYFRRLDTAAKFLLGLGVTHFSCQMQLD